MGVVKRTHPKARQNQVLRKYYRKHPEEYNRFLEDLSTQLSELMAPLMELMQNIVDAIIKLASELVDAISTKYNDIVDEHLTEKELEEQNEHRITQADPQD